MIAAEFKRDLNTNYMILDCPEEITLHNYQICMITTNDIRGMNKTNVRSADGKIRLYYEITSKQPMERVFEKRLMKFSDIQKLISSIRNILEITKEYLLDVNNLILEPEYIYMNIETGDMYFPYLPGYEKDVDAAFHKLTEFILNKIDHKDREGVVLGYELYQQTLEDNYSIPSIMERFYRDKEKIQVNEEEIMEESMDTDRKKEIELEDSSVVTGNEGSPHETAKYKKVLNAEMKKILPIMIVLLVVVVLVFIGCFLFFRIKMESITIIQILGISLLFCSLILYGFVQNIKKKRMESDKDSFMVQMEESKPEDANEEPENTETVKKESEEIYGNTVLLGFRPKTEERKLVRCGKEREGDLIITTYPYLIGKMETVVDGVISDHMVSRIHAKITKEGEMFYLTDLNSTNGTFLNGIRLESNEALELKIEDEVSFGEVEFCFK